jgi:hypothetical protein
MSSAQTLDNFSLQRPEMLSRPLAGVPWVIGIFIGAAVSFRVLNSVFDALNVGPPQLIRIGTMLAGAAIAMTWLTSRLMDYLRPRSGQPSFFIVGSAVRGLSGER